MLDWLQRRCLFISLLIFFSAIGNTQNVTLSTQNQVDNFFPGTSYTGNITIGAIAGGGISDITNLDNFLVLRELNGNLRISQNAQLKDLDGLSGLQVINGDLEIVENPALEQIEGLANLTTAYDINIRDNQVLINLNGLNEIDSFNGSLEIKNNTLLEEIDGFSNIVFQDTAGISITENSNLKSISGFNNINQAAYVIIFQNHSLETITGFSDLRLIQIFIVKDNHSLENMVGFSQLTQCLSFFLSDNESIENLDVFSNLLSVEGILQITGNSKLTDCCGIQELVSNLPPLAFVQIEDNPSECSSISEVINADCDLKVEIFKNPPCKNLSNGSIQVKVTDYNAIPFYYFWERLEDGMTGSDTSFQNYFNIEMLPEGTYNLTIITPKPDTAYVYNINLSPINGTYFEVVEVTTVNSTNELSNGIIEIIVSGGSPPYDVEWTGPGSGSLSDYPSDTIIIPSLLHGEYQINIKDSNDISTNISLTLLDETVPVFPCTKPMDIIILNDVSRSVDSVEYRQSKDFFVSLLEAVNIGLNDDDSRAGIIEWSDEDEQAIKVPLTGNIDELSQYTNAQRSYSNGTRIHEAMVFGENYLDSLARPDVERVLILATDGTDAQVPPSLIALADQFKSEGYHILTIAIDDAYNDITTRDLLIQMASIGHLAPGVPEYSQLDQNLADNIVNLYLCPIDPGSSSNVYFIRDGAIEIDSLLPISDCSNPEFVDVVFTVSSLGDLSLPGGTYVTFYLNDPEQSGAAELLSWQIPCSIPPDSSETFTISLPLNGPSHIFAVLNDDGESGIPISFPITDIEEFTYSNNIADEWICLGDNPSIQALKYTSTPFPTCDTMVIYTIDVCNISEYDAVDVVVQDQAPDGFLLIDQTINLNGCASEDDTTFDIPAGCCITLNLIYDASDAELGYYGDQDVLLSGPAGQDYFGYDGEFSSAEDVILDGTVDCPSTLVEFFKEVSVMESCDDAFITFTFTINNELNIPLQDLEFMDIVHLPATWVFEPYNITGMTIGTKSIIGDTAQFIIDQVEASTVASFSFDVSLGFWENDGTLPNTAQLANIPDLEHGVTKTLQSNSTSTEVLSSSPIELPDTLTITIDGDTINLSTVIPPSLMVEWTSDGDGTFVDHQSPTPFYIPGTQDLETGQILFTLDYQNECLEATDSILVILDTCVLDIQFFEIMPCDDNGTLNDASDDTFDLGFNLGTNDYLLTSFYIIEVNGDTLGPYSYNHINNFKVTLPADGTDQIITIVNTNFENCLITDTLNVPHCSGECMLQMEQWNQFDCNDNGTPEDASDDFFIVEFELSTMHPGLDSNYIVVLGSDTLGLFPYGEVVGISIPATGDSIPIFFMDAQIEDCTLQETVISENCLDHCNLILTTFEISDCDDNGTPSDDSDDTFILKFELDALNPGIDSAFFVQFDEDILGQFSYLQEYSLLLPADDTVHSILFWVTQNLECALDSLLLVESCSDQCRLEFVTFNITQCDDAGTGDINSDDTFELTFEVTGQNYSEELEFFMVVNNDSLGLFYYETVHTITLPVNSSDYQIEVIDAQYEMCLLTETLRVESCSNPCELSIDFFDLSPCEDNLTIDIQDDDFYSLTFNCSAAYPHEDSLFYLFINEDPLGPFAYGSDHTIDIQATGNMHTLEFVDSKFGYCSQEEAVNLDFCSFEPFEGEDIIVPNIFSPNNDNINDIWTIELFNESAILSCHIFDRWGNLVYQSQLGEIPEWDGFFNDSRVRQGVYIYKIVYENALNQTVVKYGDVTIF
ncbi:MAG: gliding motility-associated C-terminal domain-containing protein [Bacteroidota bacterium]